MTVTRVQLSPTTVIPAEAAITPSPAAELSLPTFNLETQVQELQARYEAQLRSTAEEPGESQ